MEDRDYLHRLFASHGRRFRLPIVAPEQRRLGNKTGMVGIGSVRLKPTCCGVFGLDSRLGRPRAEPQ